MKGFTLIEVLLALLVFSLIAAVALTALAGRLGISADTQRSLMAHTTMLEVAANVLEKQRLLPMLNTDEKEGDVEARGMELHWKLWSEKTMLDDFVRQNVTVSKADEPDVSLFLFHIKVGFGATP